MRLGRLAATAQSAGSALTSAAVAQNLVDLVVAEHPIHPLDRMLGDQCPLTCAKAWPIIATPSDAACMTSSVAPASDSIRMTLFWGRPRSEPENQSNLKKNAR
jgi:hypothetical protein